MPRPFRLFKKIQQNYQDLNWWKRVILTRLYSLRKNRGIYIMEEDWDNFIILDACRYDLFKNIYNNYSLPGELKKVLSRGSSSAQFMRENFSGKTFLDTVYVTSNPFIVTEIGDPFYKTIHVWKEGWDEKLQTVLPETVEEYTLQAIEKYPHKRLLIHFMQPHMPFIGKTRLKGRGFNIIRNLALNTEPPKPTETTWDLAREHKIGAAVIKKAYRDNLIRVLPSVRRLLKELPGKSIVSSDHGNVFGKRVGPPFFQMEVWGHMEKLPIKELIEVPWLKIEKGKRKKVTSDFKEQEQNKTDKELIQKRLKDLGYY